MCRYLAKDLNNSLLRNILLNPNFDTSKTSVVVKDELLIITITDSKMEHDIRKILYGDSNPISPKSDSAESFDSIRLAVLDYTKKHIDEFIRKGRKIYTDYRSMDGIFRDIEHNTPVERMALCSRLRNKYKTLTSIMSSDMTRYKRVKIAFAQFTTKLQAKLSNITL